MPVIFLWPFSSMWEKGFFMDIQDLSSIQDGLKNGILYAFIPHALELPERPELSIFPFNVMFAKFKKENGVIIIGSAIYEPVLRSYMKEGTLYSMEYFNKYGPGSWLVIEYDALQMRYHGKKYVNGTMVGSTDGKEWKMFFIHFTALGLSNGERCYFEEIPPNISN